jgi:hypothetical protein
MKHVVEKVLNLYIFLFFPLISKELASSISRNVVCNLVFSDWVYQSSEGISLPFAWEYFVSL